MTFDTYENACESQFSEPVYLVEVDLVSGTRRFSAVAVNITDGQIAGHAEGRVSKLGKYRRVLPGQGGESTDIIPRSTATIEIFSTSVPEADGSQHNYFEPLNDPYQQQTMYGRTVRVISGFVGLPVSEWRTMFSGLIDDIAFSKQTIRIIAKDNIGAEIADPVNWPTLQQYVDAGRMPFLWPDQKPDERIQIAVGQLLNHAITDRGRITATRWGKPVLTTDGALYTETTQQVRNFTYTSIREHDQRFVQETLVLYKWNAASTDTPDGITIIIPPSLPATGRWIADGIDTATPVLSVIFAAELRAIQSTTINDNDHRVVSSMQQIYTYDASSLADDDGYSALKPFDLTPSQPGRWRRGTLSGEKYVSLKWAITTGPAELVKNVYLTTRENRTRLKPSQYSVYLEPQPFGPPITMVEFPAPVFSYSFGGGTFWPNSSEINVQVELIGISTINGASLGLPAMTNPARIIREAISELTSIGASGIDSDSFDAAEAECNRRGYSFAGVVAKDGRFRDVLSAMLVSCGARLYVSRMGLVSIEFPAPGPCFGEDAPEVTDQNHVLENSLSIYPEVSTLKNQITYRWAKNIANDRPGNSPEYGGNSVAEDAQSQALYGLRAEAVELLFVENDTMAHDVMLRSLLRKSKARGRVKFDAPLYGLRFDLADVFRLTHFAGLAENGFTERVMSVQMLELDADTNKVTVEATDIEDLYPVVFVLGDESALAPLWPGMTVRPDRCYGYLADEATGEFTGGDPGKRLY